MDTRFSEKNAAQDAALETQQQHLNDMFTNLDRKFTDKNLSTEQRMNAERERFSELLGNMETKVGAKCEDLGLQLTARRLGPPRCI